MVSDPTTQLLERLEGARRTGTGWTARCPAHDDRDPSLSVSRGEDGRALVSCHAGCPPESIVTSAGLAMRDLFPATLMTNGAGTSAETRYRVVMADGSHADEVIEHVRLDLPGGSKRMWWARDGRKGLRGLSTASFALHGLDHLDPSPDVPVVVAEGERAAVALRAMGIAAVGTVTGASGSPGDDALAALSGRDVMLWPDADDAGVAHMQAIATRLPGVARSVALVTPPDGVARGWDGADATLDEAEALIAAAMPVAPSEEVRLLPGLRAPMSVARRLVSDRFSDDEGAMLIRSWRGDLHAWDGRCWPEADEESVRSTIYRYLEHAVYEVETRDGPELRPWDPTKAKVANVLDALRAVIHLDPVTEPPAWIDGVDLPDPHDLVVTANGILHLPDRRLLPHDPGLFATHSVPFAADPDAPTPSRWLAFLEQLWGDDVDSIALLQEMFGYVLSGDTSLQKIMLLVGPTRAGKGVIANVLQALLGAHNVGAPTIAGLTTNFGLQDLVGKTLAVVSDARLGAKANVQALAERLLSISGEDSITVDRKYKRPWTGRLGARFMLLSNELPRLTDASGALPRRFVVIVLTESFYGREDPALLSRLLPELPGIMNWALDGLDRLRARGRFTELASAHEAMRELEDLASPISAFLRDRCRKGPDQRVTVSELWAAWKDWTEDQALHHGTKATFGRDLRATVPGLRVTKLRDGDDRILAYIGVGVHHRADDASEVRGPDGPAMTAGPPGPWTSTASPASDDDHPTDGAWIAARKVFADLLPVAVEDPQVEDWLQAPLPSHDGVPWEQ